MNGHPVKSVNFVGILSFLISILKQKNVPATASYCYIRVVLTTYILELDSTTIEFQLLGCSSSVAKQ